MKSVTEKDDSGSGKKTICDATQQMIEKATSDGISTVFDRSETMKH